MAGIGFTVSLFIADLSFAGTGRLADAKVGILFGSLVSGVLGALILLVRRPRNGSPERTPAAQVSCAAVSRGPSGRPEGRERE